MQKISMKYKINTIISFIVGVLLTLVAVNLLFAKELKKQNNSIVKTESLANAVEKVYASVVTVQNYKNYDIANIGTGFIYKKDNKYAYILTNEHVISDSEKVKIILSDDREIDCTVLGKDKYLDLAVLRINKKYAKSIANIGSSDELRLGDTVFTIGSPLGNDYRGTVTAGVLSGKDRKVKTTAETDEDWIMKVIQIDASINHGNSGGPLFNSTGEVIGICTLKIVDDDIEGMGFAIPIEYAMNNIEFLEKGIEIKWPELGIKIINVDNSAAIASNDISISSNIKKGIVVTNVSDKGSASNILKKGDVIIKINNQQTDDIAELKYELYQYRENDIIEITYIRNGKEKKSKIKIKSSN